MEKQKKGVRLDHISKIYTDPKTGKEFYAVQDTTLDIEPGSFVTLLGPSGCGKTTTLRMIAGFESPDEGDIYLGDENINALTPNKRDTAMVFQSYALLPHINVFDNVAYGLKIRKLPKEEIHERVMNILKLVEMEGMESRMTNQLSGGQQQRVALARALVIEPSVLLFDEPLSNLDAKLRVTMRTEIRKIQQKVGITAIYVTHDQSEAMSISDKIIIMSQGRVEQIGTPREIYYHPSSRFVADFIGEANFLDAKVKSVSGEKAVIDVVGQELEVNNFAHADSGADATLPRAIIPFDLGSYFGAIPILGENEEGKPIIFDYTNPEAMNQPRTDAAEALQWIADECDKVKDVLPFRYKQEDLNWGRLNGASAYALKARALLYRASALNNPSNDKSRWQAAADAATAFFAKNNQQSNPYRLYTTADNNPEKNYYECFVSDPTPPHLNNEFILCRSEWTNTREIELFLTPCGFSGSANAVGRTNPTQNLVDSYETINGKPIDQDPSYDPQNPYANRDPRLEQTILHHGSIWGDANESEEREVDITYGSGKDYKALHGGTVTGYYTKKFLHNMSFKSPKLYTHACPIFRYAEVLLNAAEAVNEAQGPDNAYQYVNQVRARVGMPAYKGMTQEQLRERIRNERRIELCFEDHRFFDERRWKLFEGKSASNERNEPRYKQVYNIYGVQVNPGSSTIYTYGSSDLYKARAFSSPKNYYFPIPDAEIKRLPKLKQNAGWELTASSETENTTTEQ